MNTLGILNWSRVLDYDPTSVYPELRPKGTNPCGELPLAENDSCRLFASNLYSFVDNPFTDHSSFNELLAYYVFYMAQWVTDLIIDLEVEAIDKILSKILPNWKNMVDSYDGEEEFEDIALNQYSDEFKLWWAIRKKGLEGRRTGVGITGYADMMAALGLPYGESEMTERIFRLKLQAELDASIDLAIIKGPFPLWDSKKEYTFQEESVGLTHLLGKNEWYRMVEDLYPDQCSRMAACGRRNSGLSTIAPVGTGSLMAQTSSGIEPVFKPVYKRRKVAEAGVTPDFIDVDGVGYTEFVVVHPKLKEFAQIDGIWNPLEDYSYEDWIGVFEQSPYYNNTAEDIDPIERVKTQALIQKYITSSISSTVNLPSTATEEDIDSIYRAVFDLRVKGITVYRDGSRAGVLVDARQKTKRGEIHPSGVIKRPKSLEADYYRVIAGGKELIVLVGLYENEPYEIFAFRPQEGFKIPKQEHKGTITKIRKRKYTFDSELIQISDLQLANEDVIEKAVTLMASIALRHGMGIEYAIKTIDKIDDNIVSFSRAVVRILRKYLKETTESGEVCPDCGGKIVYEGGCKHCDNPECTYSACG